MKPYFLWDYNLSNKQIRQILKGQNQTEKRWLMGRILTSCHFKDVWKYLTVKDIAVELPNLKIRPEVKNAWQRALNVWNYHVETAQ